METLRIPLFAVLLVGLLPAPAVQADLPLKVDVAARALAPGEPLRIIVACDEPLAEVEGRFLGRRVDFARDAPGEGTRWTGWSLVALDDPPGPVAIEVVGHTAAGAPVEGSRAVTVEAREFPVERLSVAPGYVEPPPDVQRRLADERERLSAIYERRDAGPRLASPFVRPVPGGPTSIFGTRRVFNGEPRSPHPGLDLRAATGTPVLASGPGTVVLASDLYYSGNTVIVDHGGGLFTLYAHLSRLGVDEGQQVAAGDRVGLSGATGRVTGPHLHWGAKIGDLPFDPCALLDGSLFGD